MPGVEGYRVPTAASAFKGSKGMWERPLVALSNKGIWGTPPQEAKVVIPEGGRLQVGAQRGPDLIRALGLQPHVIASVFSRCFSSRCPPGRAS